MNHLVLQDEDLEIILLQLLSLGEVRFLHVFSSQINKRSLHIILKSLMIQQLPQIFNGTRYINNSLKYRWIISRLLITEDYLEFPFYNYDTLIEYEFANMTDKQSQNLKNAIAKYESGDVNDELSIIKFAASFLQYQVKHQSMADFILKKYSQYFAKVPFSKLINNFQFQCLNLFINIDKIEIPNLRITFNGYSNFENLFQIPRAVKKGNILFLIQNMLIQEYYYPNSLTNDPDGRLQSLINTAIVKKIHFIDMLRQLSYDLFKQNKIEECIKEARAIEGLQYWILLSHQPKNTIEYFKNLDLPYFEVKSAAADLLNRLKNDHSFLLMLRQNTGQPISENTLLEQSIPYIMLMFLQADDPLPFQNIADTQLFCISDKDRLIDADFVWSYFAETNVIKILNDLDSAEEKLAEVQWYISHISNREKRQSLLKDIFSTMFIKDIDDHYVCLQFVAEFILTMILDLSDDNELTSRAQTGHMILQVSRSISSGMMFEDLIFPKKDQLFKALLREDWLIANHIASIDSELNEFKNAFKTVYDFKKEYQNGHVEYDPSNPTFISKSSSNPHLNLKPSSNPHTTIEIALSFPGQEKALNLALEYYGIEQNSENEIYKTIIENHLKNVKKLNPCKIIKSLKKDVFNSIQRSFTRLSSTIWNLISFEFDSKLNNLKCFIDYINSILDLVLNKERLSETVFDALNKNPVDFISQLYHNGKISEAEKLAKLLKHDMMQILITDSSTSEKIINNMVTENPIIGTALMMSKILKDGGIETNPINSDNPQHHIVFNMINLGLKSNYKENSLKQVFGLKAPPKDLIQTNTNFEHIKSLIENEEFNLEEIIITSYNMNEKEFSDIIIQISYELKHFHRIYEIIQNCASISPELYDSISFLKTLEKKNIQIESLDQIFSDLLKSKCYTDASKFLKLFENKFDAIKLIRDASIGLIKSGNRQELESEMIYHFPEFESTIIDTLSIDEFNIDSSNDKAKKAELSLESIEDFNEIKQIISQNPLTDFDDELLKIVQRETYHIESFVLAVKKYISCFRSVQKLLDLFVPILIAMISSITVDSLESEILAWNHIHSVYSLILILDHYIPLKDLSGDHQIFVNRTRNFVQIVDHQPFLLLGINYNFSNFGLNSSIENSLVRIDFTNIYKELFGNQSSNMIDNYVSICSKLGFVPTDFAHNLNLTFGPKLFYQISLEFDHAHLIEPSIIPVFSDTFPPDESTLTALSSIIGDQFKRTEMISNNEFKFSIKNSNKQLSNIKKFFKDNSPIEIIVPFYSQKCKFSKALTLLNDSLKKEFPNDKNAFLEKYSEFFNKYIFEYAVAYSGYLFSLVKQANFDKELFSGVLPLSGPYLRFELYSYLKQWMEAYNTSVELFCEPQDDLNAARARALNLLSRAQNCLENIEDYSEERELNKCQVELQREFCIFTINNGLECDYSELNLFQNDHKRESMIIFLLNNMNMKLAVAIMRFYMINTTNVGERICDIILNESPEKITLFLNSLESELEKKTFHEIFYAIIARLAYVIELPKNELHQYIIVLNDSKIRSLMLFQFEFIEEAAKIAINDNDKELLSMIAKEAYHQQNLTLMSKCLKCLEK